MAQGFNRLLVDRIWDVWNRDRVRGRAGEFVNLAADDLDDPVARDAWKLVPTEMRYYIRQKFGDSGFMVRKDMLENAVGRREASVGDMWTGLSRLDPKTQKSFQDTMRVVLGRNAFKTLVTAEKAWQAGVSVAKNTIVIRSVIVPASNLFSNFMQLMTIGVGPRDIAKGFQVKLVEVNQYLANEERRIEIQAEMARYRDVPSRIARSIFERESVYCGREGRMSRGISCAGSGAAGGDQSGAYKILHTRTGVFPQNGR